MEESPAFEMWHDSKWIEFYQYDLYVALGLKNDARRMYEKWSNQTDDFPRQGTHWFRDFFYPLWRDHGHAQVMVNFFELVAKYFPRGPYGKDKHPRYTRRMNWGEFIHFMSGAANQDIRPLARRAFGWPPEWNDLYKKAARIFRKSNTNREPAVKVALSRFEGSGIKPRHEVPHFSVRASRAPLTGLCWMPSPCPDAAWITKSHISLMASRRPGRSQGGDRFHGPATIGDCWCFDRSFGQRPACARTGRWSRPSAPGAGAGSAPAPTEGEAQIPIPEDLKLPLAPAGSDADGPGVSRPTGVPTADEPSKEPLNSSRPGRRPGGSGEAERSAPGNRIRTRRDFRRGTVR